MKLLEERVFHPGDRLRELDLAERFQVSRGPVREALRILEASSIVRIEPMRGATISRLSDEEAIDSIEASAVLFGLIAQRAAERANASGLEAARDALQELKRLENGAAKPQRFFDQTLQIGLHVCDMCGSARLKRLLFDIRFGAPNYFGPLGFTTAESRRQAIDEWSTLLESIAVGQGLAARDLAIAVHKKALQAALDLSH
jgi:DNA-binding GntR family transcriptional regulator